MKRVLRIIAKTGDPEDEEIEITLKLKKKVIRYSYWGFNDIKKEDIEKKFEEYKDKIFKLLMEAGFHISHIKVK